MTSEEAEYADGKKLAAWFRSRNLPPLKGGGKDYMLFQRYLTRWEGGEGVSFYTAERYLNLFGYYCWELPDDVWIEKPKSKRGRKPIDPRIRAKVMEAVSAGEPSAVVARRYGVSAKTVYVWKHGAAA